MTTVSNLESAAVPGTATIFHIDGEWASATGRGVSVAIIDSGIAYDHAALGGGFGAAFRVVGGRDFTGE